MASTESFVFDGAGAAAYWAAAGANFPTRFYEDWELEIKEKVAAKVWDFTMSSCAEIFNDLDDCDYERYALKQRCQDREMTPDEFEALETMNSWAAAAKKELYSRPTILRETTFNIEQKMLNVPLNDEWRQKLLAVIDEECFQLTPSLETLEEFLSWASKQPARNILEITDEMFLEDQSINALVSLAGERLAARG